MADENLFGIELVTPERILVTGTATEVILRTSEGDITFLPGHTPLVGTIEPGVVRVVRDGGDVERVATHGGFVQVEHHVPSHDDSAGPPSATAGTRVTMLVGVAELAEEIDVDRARIALEAAEARVTELIGAGGGRAAGAGSGEGEESVPEVVEAEAALRRAQVRIETVDASAGVTAPTT
jgi:F-type H+-transporting ATPase subunit epsilon